ncbi:fused response regulator/phosphatase [Aciduricibacillus chroicocephali]|uniref:Fused response regulator/phosphatase n=1 Tax=Aciduricibacillus chroicocephali TaxID=3054939 RepID=A0ABY9KTY9_9BACI|nr:fused response regulator/phosphatase [Bacillaceae bacterium 44XB]
MGIIIVDDNKVNLFVMEKILKAAGYEEFESFTSAQSLYDHLQLAEPVQEPVEADLILLDIMMPDIDGIEACKEIRKHARYKDLPIIFVTSLDDSQILAKALDAGGTDYISKPINKMELLARIRAALRLKKELDLRKESELKIHRDLKLAARVQRGLLNKPISEDIRIDVTYKPSSALSGDMYYWQKFDDNRYGIMLFDVMGHGVSSSLVCMFVSSILREAMKNLREPELVIKELNRQMSLLDQETSDIPFYFTAIYLIIDPLRKTVEYVNAGHPPGFLNIDGSQTVALSGGSCAIGFFDEIKVKTTTVSYEDHIQIMLFTDGVYEAMKLVEIEADKHLEKVTSEDWGDLAPSLDDITPHQNEQPDDICLITIQVK